MGNTKVATHSENASDGPLKLKSEIGPGWVEIMLPVLTVSEANISEHWGAKHKRHKRQKSLVAIMLNPHQHALSLPCSITLTRYAPRKLDKHDNLPMSLKWILDACCEIITGDYRPGRADETEQISVAYEQVTSKQYAVKIRIMH